MATDDRILSLALRPRRLSEMVGQSVLVAAIRAQVAKRRPSAFLLSGASGTGKTTLARIMATAFQCAHQKEWGEPCESCSLKKDYHEVNASDVSGVEEIGQVADRSRYNPSPGSAYRIIILDECFPGDTLLDTPNHAKIAFKDVRAGDVILNASGEDVVRAIWRRKVENAVKIVFSGKSIICSRNHLFLTPEGWVRASRLKVGKRLVRTCEALRILCQETPLETGVHERPLLQQDLLPSQEAGDHPNQIGKEGAAALQTMQGGYSGLECERLQAYFLRPVLRREIQFQITCQSGVESEDMEDPQSLLGSQSACQGARQDRADLGLETSGTFASQICTTKTIATKAVRILQKAVSFERSAIRESEVLQSFLQYPFLDIKTRRTRKFPGTLDQRESDVQTRCTGEDGKDIEGDGASPPSVRGKRPSFAKTAKYSLEGFGERLGNGIRRIIRSAEAGVSYLLQVGYCTPEEKDRNRSGRKGTPELARSLERYQERQCTDFVRVESLALLEPGNPELEQYREADGFVYFYDLEATWHPSFSVNGILVHNCQMLTVNSQNLLLKHFEDAPKTTIWFICTTAPNKILLTLRRRCMAYQLKPLTVLGCENLLKRAVKQAQIKKPLDPLIEEVHAAGITSPGLLLMALEKYAAGLEPRVAVAGSETVSVDTLQICRAVLAGDWRSLSNVMKDATAEESRWIRASVGGYLRGVLIRETVPGRAERVAAALTSLMSGTAPLDDAALYNWLWGQLYLICRKMRSQGE